MAALHRLKPKKRILPSRADYYSLVNLATNVGPPFDGGHLRSVTQCCIAAINGPTKNRLLAKDRKSARSFLDGNHVHSEPHVQGVAVRADHFVGAIHISDVGPIFSTATRRLFTRSIVPSCGPTRTVVPTIPPLSARPFQNRRV